MVSKFQNISQMASPVAPVAQEVAIGFSHGLRTSVPASMVTATELTECVNLQINRGGQLQSRAGLDRLNTVSLGKIITLASCKIGSTIYNLAQTSDFVIHKINADKTSTVIGTAEGEAEIIGYDGYAVVADGSYLKYIDDTETLKIGWDGGDGFAASFFNNISDTISGYINYTSAQTNKVEFTTPAWTAGYTIALTKLSVKLGRAGTGGTGYPALTVYRTSDDAIMASGITEIAASGLAPDPGDFENVNLTSVIELSPSTAYYIRLSMPSYDGTNYVIWYTGDSASPICKVSPGLGPKASHMLVHGRRLWLYGDPSYLGVLYYNNYTPFDWSTPTYSGYVTTLDDNKSSYPIGAAISYFGSLYVYGTEEWPFFLQLTGTTGSDFVLSDMHQPLWTLPKMVASIINDTWSVNRSGVASLTGVNLYGDVRTYSESFAIDDQIERDWTEDAFMGYYKGRGQLWVSIGDKVFVAHTKAAATMSYEDVVRYRYPWSEYTFNFTPSCFGQWDELVIGSEEGFIYTPNGALTKDDTEAFDISMKTKYYQSPFIKLDVLDIKVLIDANSGTNFDIVAYKDGNTLREVHRWSLASALHDDTTIADIGDASIEDLTVPIDPMSNPLTQHLGFTCFAYQLKIDNLTVLGSPAHIDGLVIRYRPMED